MKCDELKVYVPQDGPWGKVKTRIVPRNRKNYAEYYMEA